MATKETMEGKANTTNYVSVRDSTASDSTTSNVTYSVRVGCPYEHKCTDYGKRCDSCRHGRRSYYEPEEPYYPYYPYIPYIPYYPYPYHPWEITWYTTTTSDDIGDDLTMPTTSCYSDSAWTVYANGTAIYHASYS